MSGRIDASKRIAAINAIVMPGFMPGIHVFIASNKQDVDGRDKPGHDGCVSFIAPPG